MNTNLLTTVALTLGFLGLVLGVMGRHADPGLMGAIVFGAGVIARAIQHASARSRTST